MIKHVVFFKFKPEASDAERKEALDALRELPDKIDAIRDYEIGEDVLRGPRAWDVVLIGTYDDLEALDRYVRHDDHTAAAMKIRALCDAIGSVDYEY